MFEELLVGAAQGILTSVWVAGTQPTSAETGYSADAAQLQQQLQQQHPTGSSHQQRTGATKNGSDLLRPFSYLLMKSGWYLIRTWVYKADI
jgi:hypothetical protein